MFKIVHLIIRCKNVKESNNHSIPGFLIKDIRTHIHTLSGKKLAIEEYA